MKLMIMMMTLLWFPFLFICETYCVNKNLCWTKVTATRVTRVLMLQSVTLWMYEYVCEKLFDQLLKVLYIKKKKNTLQAWCFFIFQILWFYTLIDVMAFQGQFLVWPQQLQVKLLRSKDEVVFGEFWELLPGNKLHNRQGTYCLLTLRHLNRAIKDGGNSYWGAGIVLPSAARRWRL